MWYLCHSDDRVDYFFKYSRVWYIYYMMADIFFTGGLCSFFLILHKIWGEYFLYIFFVFFLSVALVKLHKPCVIIVNSSCPLVLCRYSTLSRTHSISQNRCPIWGLAIFHTLIVWYINDVIIMYRMILWHICIII